MAMNQIPNLGRRELEIMTVVWELGEATVRQVWQRLGCGAYTTVLTMMRALEEQKQVLAHRVEGKSYVYRAIISQEAFAQASAADLCARVFGGSIPLLVHNLLGQQRPSREDIEQLKQILAAEEANVQP
jgi:BlaI family transcriptional regulator, penicillinase repressor